MLIKLQLLKNKIKEMFAVFGSGFGRSDTYFAMYYTVKAPQSFMFPK